MAMVDSPPAPRHRSLLPFRDPWRGRRLAKVAGWIGAVTLAVGVLAIWGFIRSG